MIIIVHNFSFVTKIINDDAVFIDPFKKKRIGEVIYKVAKKNPEEIIVWSHEDAQEFINKEYILKIMSFDRLMISYTPNTNYLSEDIGYIEDSPFININKKIKYPTWQMSSLVGAINSSIILQMPIALWYSKNSIDFILNSVAKLYQPLGLFCYSEPRLLLNSINSFSKKQGTQGEIFKFVSQHYKIVWCYLLFTNYLVYEKRITLFNLVKTLFYSKTKNKGNELIFKRISQSIDYKEETIDVIIPTIGRKKYLYDILKDLSLQTHLPKTVIIVEQNSVQGSVSELEYINSESWPFFIKHIFTHQVGACNARNLALEEVKSKWCFLADDDIRIEPKFLEKGFEFIVNLKIDSVVFNCLQKNQENECTEISQTTIFGSGCSIFNRRFYNFIYFDKKIEFGFGEDLEFGMQLRNKGCDIIYLPEPSILHLKAPVGGFRTKFVHSWENDVYKPKPSPTIMYVKRKYSSLKQLQGYKTVLFLKFYKVQNIKNPLAYFLNFKKQWKISEKWAEKLKENEI
ncbi:MULTISPECIES: glycosyltransferase family 2 protein [Flavobacterium]|uniref:Glycosyltransferase family 2 protein n=1 Tax=Flavobacterium columnare TaxID=996 RepID=A0AA94F2W3_9FLAO|nr:MULTISPECIES: glycosyltransferase family A protein [Flavobacterium]MCH4829012.1 glycosyltransferase family 2 protein [Flavobacterium columnare]MCH4833786.1 glycosyltransferase family 2 protein [Flavobacterium columnare]QYS91347.1 glycosyltransferase family 2 protein [Flavobacterium covae]